MNPNQFLISGISHYERKNFFRRTNRVSGFCDNQPLRASPLQLVYSSLSSVTSESVALLKAPDLLTVVLLVAGVGGTGQRGGRLFPPGHFKLVHCL